MAGYTRQSAASIVNGSPITAPPLNAEFTQIVSALAASTGHKHDGTTAEGGYVPLIADSDAKNKIVADQNNNRFGVFVEVGTTPVEQVRFQDGAIVPVTNSDIDLGGLNLEFKDLFIDGTAHIDTLDVDENASIAGTFSVTDTSIFTGAISAGSLTTTGNSIHATVDINGGAIDSTIIGASTAAAGSFTTVSTTGQATLATADINGGTIDGSVIGGATPQAVTGTIITANTGFTGALTGDVTGNVTGNLTGDVTGDVTGDLTGNVTASSGTTTLNNLVVDGTVDFTSTALLNVSDPVSPQQASTKNYTDTADDLKLNLAGGTMSGAVAMGTNKITGLGNPADNQDAVTKFYSDTADALKLNLSGGTLSGDITMGGNTVTGLGAPSASSDAVSKFYADTADALQLNLSGGTMSGAIAMGTNKITGLGTPSDDSDAATKGFVDTSIANVIEAAPAALDTLNELAAALGDDANFSTTVTNSLATKLPLAGGTMTGDVTLGVNKATSTATPATDDTLTRKGYVDDQDATKLDLAGGTMTGNLAMGDNSVTGLAAPSGDNDAARKVYIDDADALKLDLAGGTLSGDITLGANKATSTATPTTDDTLTRKGYVDTNDALKLNLSGGTMSGAIAMGASKIIGLGDPSANQDAATKAYTDTQDATKLNLSGGTMTGNVVLGSNKATSTATPTAVDDLTRKGYVDSILGSATSSAASAAAASTSETNAATSETNAGNSAAAAAASYDDFDDRYLGAKSSAPSTDNDGDALETGSLYWNTTSNDLHIWDGSNWQQGSFTAGSLMANVLEDTTPQLGGNLDLNSNNITGTGNLGITGNITLTGTVDGRDVSSDGAKLDGIAAGATNVTNNNQLTNGAGYTTNVGDITGVTAGSGISGGGTSGTVTVSHSDTSSQGSVNNSGATVIQDVTLDTYGHVTGLGSHTLTLANLGYTGATNANYITNNNQLTNGAGYTTYTANQSLNTSNSPSFAGLNINGNLNAVDDIYLADQILHEGDTDTYMQFHAADQWRVVTGGTERLEVNNSQVTITNGLTVSDGDITLSGTGRIQGVDTVSSGTDATNKNYVDTAISNISASPTVDLTDSGSGISAGSTVIVTSDGKAEEIGESSIATSISQTTTVLASGLTRSQGNVAYGNGYVVAVYVDTNYDLCTVSGLVNANGTVSWTTHRVQYAATCTEPRVCYLEDHDRWVIGFRNSAVSNRFYVVACTMDESSGRLNAYYGLTANTSNTVPVDIEVTANGHTAIFCMRQNNRQKTQTIRMDPSTYAISPGSLQEWTTSISYHGSIVYNKALDRVVLFYKNSNNPRLRLLEPPPSFSDPTMVSAANEVVASSLTVQHAGNLTCAMDTSGKFVGYFKASTGTTNVILADVTATSISVRSVYVYSSTLYFQQYGSIVYDSNLDKFLWVFKDYTSGSNRPVKGVTITAPASGNLVSGSFTEVASTANAVDNFSYSKGAYAPAMYGMVYTPYNNSQPSAGGNQIEALIYRSASAVTNLTTENFIGFAAGTYSANATATINLIGTSQGSQSGLTAGKKHYVQSDGSLSTTAGSPSVYAGIATSSSNIIVKG